MPFVKLDCGILDSTIWEDREAREVFITALLMARPVTLEGPQPELEAFSPDPTGWEVPAGEYGLVKAPARGIIRRACIDPELGAQAIARLSSPEQDSRTPDHDGRRMVRIAEGFIVLNFHKYREKDNTAAIRSKRYREKSRHAVTSQENGGSSRIPSASASASGSGVCLEGGAGGNQLANGGSGTLPPTWDPGFNSFVGVPFTEKTYAAALEQFRAHHCGKGTCATENDFRGRLATWATKLHQEGAGKRAERPGAIKPRQPNAGLDFSNRIRSNDQ